MRAAEPQRRARLNDGAELLLEWGQSLGHFIFHCALLCQLRLLLLHIRLEGFRVLHADALYVISHNTEGI